MACLKNNIPYTTIHHDSLLAVSLVLVFQDGKEPSFYVCKVAQ